jgi:hypothetical protein
MLQCKGTFFYISLAPFRFFTACFIIILFIIILVIGNSLFQTAYDGLHNQIQTFLPGSLLVKNSSPQADALYFPQSEDACSLILPQSAKIAEYLSAQHAVASIVPFKLTRVQLETEGYSMNEAHALCLHPDALNLLTRHLFIEQGNLTSLQRRGVMVSDLLIERLFHTSNIKYKVGDLLTLSPPLVSSAFSRCKVPITAIFKLKQNKNEFDFISTLIILDETSFNIITNLPLGEINLDPTLEKLVLHAAQPIFKDRDSLFIRSELCPDRHSVSSLFSLLDDPAQKYASLPIETHAWQGIALTVRESAAQNTRLLRHNLSRFFRAQHIPARVTDWPAVSIPVLRQLALKHTVFIIMLIFFGLFIITLSVIISRPNKKQLQFILKTEADNSRRWFVHFFTRQAVLQSLLCGFLGMMASGLVFLCFLNLAASRPENSWICALFESTKLHPDFHIAGLLYALIFLVVYSFSSWMYAFFISRK